MKPPNRGLCLCLRRMATLTREDHTSHGSWVITSLQSRGYTVDLGRLTDRRRLVLFMHGFAGWDLSDIARCVGCSRQAVSKSWVAAVTEIRDQVIAQDSRLAWLIGRDIP
jgi:DNA-directed RNA polymerase specialized sigma24 family protein